MSGPGAESGQPIVVAGDVSIDWLAWPQPAVVPGDGAVANWRHREGTRMVARRGGALLLVDLLRTALGKKGTVVGPQVPDADLHIKSPDHYLHSIVDLEPMVKPATHFKVSRLRGFAGPARDNPVPPDIEGEFAKADLVVLDDSGNGFRDASQRWRQLLQGTRPSWLVFKMARPLAVGKLWDQVRLGPLVADGKHDPRRLVVVLNADDLREEGYGLTRPLTWERTAEEFVQEVASNARFAPFRDCAHLIVRFDCDGAIHYRGGSRPAATIHFDPQHAEGGFVASQGSRMMGMTAAFTAGLVAALAADPACDPAQGMRPAMTFARRLAAAGFRQDDNGAPRYPMSPDFDGAEAAHSALDIPVERIIAGEAWSILHSQTDPLKMAMDVARTGPKAAGGIPVARFGKFQTADRREIEAFRAIANLLVDYLQREQSKPISIGVFGRPGSGKSFGVAEVAGHIANAVATQGSVKKLDFNLSQFTTLGDLAAAFHLVRDVALSGDIALAFFDEFDAPFQGDLGWLRYFLAPMQDGRFRDGAHEHPIGRAIFVFAGGTRHSFKEFIAPMTPREGNQASLENERIDFTAAKGPDFASRLRGTVDIVGPDWLEDGDPYTIRRAFLLHSIVRRDYKSLFEDDKQMCIDDDVLRALLTVRGLRHGARSLEAILAMSGLAGRTRFTRAFLPPLDQLDLHVDADDFMGRVQGERLDYELREQLGEAVHNAYRRNRLEVEDDRAERKKLEADDAMRDWSALAEVFRESSRQQADDIPRKLEQIGCIMSADGADARPRVTEFTPDEVDMLARAEHARFEAERRRKRWRLGPRDAHRRRSPSLVPWDQLGAKWQSLDIGAVRAIPSVLQAAGLYIYRDADSHKEKD